MSKFYYHQKFLRLCSAFCSNYGFVFNIYQTYIISHIGKVKSLPADYVKPDAKIKTLSMSDRAGVNSARKPGVYIYICTMKFYERIVP